MNRQHLSCLLYTSISNCLYCTVITCRTGLWRYGANHCYLKHVLCVLEHPTEDNSSAGPLKHGAQLRTICSIGLRPVLTTQVCPMEVWFRGFSLYIEQHINISIRHATSFTNMLISICTMYMVRLLFCTKLDIYVFITITGSIPYYYHWVDTSVGERLVVSVSALTWFIRYIHY